MKKLLLVLMLATTVAQAEAHPGIDQLATGRFPELHPEVGSGYQESAQDLGIDSGTATGIKGVFIAEAGLGANDKGSIVPQVEELTERMMNDQRVMSLVRAMQDDPEMQSLLNDPATMSAVQGGDVGTLMKNPVFMKLLNDPRVREIEKSMQQGGMK